MTHYTFQKMELNDDEYVLGIDLGTTNTCAAYYVNGMELPEVIVYPQGSRLFESCVEYNNGAVIAGYTAKNHLRNGRSGIVRNAKRILGQYYSDKTVQECVKKNHCGVDIVERDNKPVFEVGGQYIMPSDVSAKIIKDVVEKSREIARERGATKLKKVVITFPANFTNNQRTATLLAAEKAGIRKEQLKMMNEPSAAALFYCKRNDINNKTILIYDLGGGTFDVSILRVEGDDYTVLKYNGDFFLGGADFDALLAEFIKEKAKSIFGSEIFTNLPKRLEQRFKVRFNEIAEEVKKDLATNTISYASLDSFILHNDDDSQEYSVPVELNDLNNCISEYIDKTMHLVRKCLEECHMTPDDIDRVVLIGGSSRLKIVRSRLAAMFGPKLGQEVNPDEAVACGACQSLITDLHLKDRIVYSLGQLLSNNRVQCLLPRQSVIPLKSREIPTHPARDYVTTINCAVYQGHAANPKDIESADDCYLLDEYKITGFGSNLRTDVTFLTTFSVDEWGIIHVVDRYKEKNCDLVNMMFRWREPE